MGLRLGVLFTISGVCLLTGCVPPCGIDDLEPNDTSVRDLGVFSDAESGIELDLSLHDESDVDLFRFDVIDQGVDGNPEITLTIDSDDEATQVDILFECADGSLKSFQCAGAERRQTSVGCVNEGLGRRTIVLNYDCASGNIFDNDDDAIVEVRISRLSNTQTCAPYRLGVFVD